MPNHGCRKEAFRGLNLSTRFFPKRLCAEEKENLSTQAFADIKELSITIDAAYIHMYTSKYAYNMHTYVHTHIRTHTYIILQISISCMATTVCWVPSLGFPSYYIVLICCLLQLLLTLQK